MRLTGTQVRAIIKEEISGALKSKEMSAGLPTSLKEAFAIAKSDAHKLPALLEAIRLMVESAQMYVAAKPFELSSGQTIPAGSNFITTDGWGWRAEEGQVQVHYIPAKLAKTAREHGHGMKWMLQRGQSGESWYVDPSVVQSHAQPQVSKP